MEAKRTARIGALALGIALVTAAVYWPVLDNEFVSYDDDLYILNSAHVVEGLTGETVTWAFTSFRGANWFPLTRLSWAADVSLFGLDPAGFHGTSLLFHVASAALLFVALLRLSGALWCSVFAAAIFALHPLHVESVAWAAARKDVVSGLFAVLTLLAYERFVRRGWAYYPVVFLCLALGLMAKPTLVTLPFVLLLLDAWPLARLQDGNGRYESARVRRAVVEKLPLFALTAAVSAVAFVSQSQWGTLQELSQLPFAARVANAATSVVAYVGDAFWPVGLSVFYPHPGGALEALPALGAAAALLGISAAALYAWRSHPEFAVGWLWFVGMLVPVIGLVQVGQAARADRYTYLPLIGLSIPVVWAAAAVASRGRGARLAVAAIGVAGIAALGVATRAQVLLWRDSTTLFEHALAVTERNHVAHINLGVVAYNRGDNAAASRQLLRALEIAPSSAVAAGVLGDVYVATGRPDEALRLYHRAQEREPDSKRWQEGVANALLDLGRPEESEATYRALIEGGRDRYQLHANLGLALANQGRHGEAIAAYQRALSLRPDLEEVHGNLGVSLAAEGDQDQAAEHFRRALELDPGLALVRAHYGNLLAARRDYDAAIPHLREAVQLEPRNPKFHAVLALVLFETNEYEESEAHHRRAMELGSRSLVSVVGLAQIALSQRRGPEAVAFSEEAVEISKRRVSQILALLADAYALAERFDDAVTVAEEALSVARARGDDTAASSYERNLEAYRAGRRY